MEMQNVQLTVCAYTVPLSSSVMKLSLNLKTTAQVRSQAGCLEINTVLGGASRFLGGVWCVSLLFVL